MQEVSVNEEAECRHIPQTLLDECDAENESAVQPKQFDLLQAQAIGWLGLCGIVVVSLLANHFFTQGKRSPSDVVDPGPMQISLNQSQLNEVELLPGLGPKLAKRIVEFRDQRGRIHDLAELAEVPGIGTKTLQRLRPWLVLDDT